MTGGASCTAMSPGIRVALGCRSSCARHFHTIRRPEYLIFDRAANFNAEVVGTIKSFGIEPKRTSFRSPWQNGVAERFVGNCRRDLLDHVIVLNERHLKRLMTEYVRYYHDDRTHLGLEKQTPAGREAAERRAQVAGSSPCRGLAACTIATIWLPRGFPFDRIFHETDEDREKCVCWLAVSGVIPLRQWLLPGHRSSSPPVDRVIAKYWTPNSHQLRCAHGWNFGEAQLADLRVSGIFQYLSRLH